mmetsp:Transcript_11699/g.31302  ORF Transcript_11699/g.31302 Transcript_11699/m.31302 type:complete len:282 (+) Transcript_11699:272-1117(+)
MGTKSPFMTMSPMWQDFAKYVIAAIAVTKKVFTNDSSFSWRAHRQSMVRQAREKAAQVMHSAYQAALCSGVFPWCCFIVVLRRFEIKRHGLRLTRYSFELPLLASPALCLLSSRSATSSCFLAGCGFSMSHAEPSGVEPALLASQSSSPCAVLADSCFSSWPNRSLEGAPDSRAELSFTADSLTWQRLRCSSAMAATLTSSGLSATKSSCRKPASSESHPSSCSACFSLPALAAKTSIAGTLEAITPSAGISQLSERGVMDGLSGIGGGKDPWICGILTND